MPTRPSFRALGLFLWVLIVAIWLVYPRLSSGWPVTLAQILVYLAMTAPVLIWSRSTFLLFGSPRWQIIAVVFIVGATLVAAGLILHLEWGLVPVALRAAAAAIGEETVFRGFIWEQLSASGWRIPIVLSVDTVAFVLFHVPAMVGGCTPRPSHYYSVSVRR